MNPRIVVIAGSTRAAAFSRQMAHAALLGLARLDAEVDHIELADYPAPLYNGDDEAASGIPPNIVKLQHKFTAMHGLLICSPEYNGSITPLLKNTLDWCSRSNPQDKVRSGAACYAGKACGLLSTSAGALGGLRALFHVRDIVGYLNMLVIPQQLALSRAHEAFAEDGALKDPALQKALNSVLGSLVTTARQIAGEPSQ